MVSWGTIKTLLLTLGPLLLPRLIAYYRSIRSSGAAHNVPIQPTPPGIKRALNFLFGSALLSLVFTLPAFQPSNIFALTNSRLQIPNDVLFVRLSTIRPLTPTDYSLKHKLASMDTRLQYLTFGPDTISNCPFCNTDDPTSYLYYALPSILAPHLFHIAILGLVTSSLFSGPEASIWRTQATVVGTALAALELYLRASYDARINARATRLSEVDFFHWRMLFYRGLAIALVDAFLAWMLYLSSTNRAFVKPPSISKRLEQTTRLFKSANNKLQALSIATTTITKDERLRRTMQRYWDAEDQMDREVFGHKEMQDRVRDVTARLDLSSVEHEADKYADDILRQIQSLREDASAAAVVGGGGGSAES